MLTKRDFVKSAAAAVVATAVVPRGSAATDIVVATAVVPRGSAATDIVVVYNEWHPEAVAFARELSRRATQVLAIQADAGKLWYDTLRALVAGGSRRIVGLTTHTDLLILRTLARDQGLKVCRSHRGSDTRLVSWVLT